MNEFISQFLWLIADNRKGFWVFSLVLISSS